MFSSLRRYLGLGKKVLIVLTIYIAIISIFSGVFEKNKVSLSFEANEQVNRERFYKLIQRYESDATADTKWMVNVYKGSLCVFIGEACGEATVKDKPQKGILTFMTDNMLLVFTRPPASGIGWAKESLAQSGFIPKTEAAFGAQGIGFTAMQPFMGLWKIFRDFSYMLLVLILISIGFMIMFRMKLNPQTVISVESALPKIVISLLLITFSFAIAGFLIDLMYVVIAILINVMSGPESAPYYDPDVRKNFYFNGTGFTIFESMFPTETSDAWSGVGHLTKVGNALIDILGEPAKTIVRTISGLFLGLNLFKITWSTFGHVAGMFGNIAAGTFSAGNIPTGFFGLILQVVTFIIGAFFGSQLLPQLVVGILILVTMIFLAFRIFFMLLRSYIQILLLVVFAPLILLFEAVPGKSAFGFWFKMLFVELLTFPITIAIFTLGYIIVNRLPDKTVLWAPPMTAGFDADAFLVVVGMTLIFTLPDLVKTTKAFLGVKEGLPIGLNLGTFFGGAATGAGGVMGLAGGFGSLSLAVPGLRRKAMQITKGTFLSDWLDQKGS